MDDNNNNNSPPRKRRKTPKIPQTPPAQEHTIRLPSERNVGNIKRKKEKQGEKTSIEGISSVIPFPFPYYAPSYAQSNIRKLGK